MQFQASLWRSCSWNRGDQASLVLTRLERVPSGQVQVGGLTLFGLPLFAFPGSLAAAAETWLLLRASGTEPLLRVYCESCSKESVEKILKVAQEFVLKGTAA